MSKSTKIFRVSSLSKKDSYQKLLALDAKMQT